MDASDPVLISGAGRVWGLKEFVTFVRSELTSKTVAQVCTDAGMSRANFYFLMAGKQKPKVESLIALFNALEMDSVSAPPGGEHDLQLKCALGTFAVDLKMDATERAKAWKRLSASRLDPATAGAAGVAGAALGGAPGLLALAAYKGIKRAHSKGSDASSRPNAAGDIADQLTDEDPWWELEVSRPNCRAKRSKRSFTNSSG